MGLLDQLNKLSLMDEYEFIIGMTTKDPKQLGDGQIVVTLSGINVHDYKAVKWAFSLGRKPFSRNSDQFGFTVVYSQITPDSYPGYQFWNMNRDESGTIE